jgi:predicted secreted hydrolase
MNLVRPLLCSAMPMVCCALLAATACGRPSDSEADGLSLSSTLGGGDTAGYLRALEPRVFAFPEDHGPHPGFRTEWWYATGHLQSSSGRRFGYQFTLFRSALAPSRDESPSAWATRQVYMGHFALTDVDGGTFVARERFARGAAGLAGAQTAPLRVWLEGWELAGGGSGDGFPMTIVAEDDSMAIDLTLEVGKGIVLNGDGGLSRKSSEPGNASYYYSLPRMPTVGSVRVGDETLQVSGDSWLDREWSTSVLSDGQVGWDWFAIQLDDGREVMAYRIRLADGSPAPESAGSLIDVDAGIHRLSFGQELQIEDVGTWVSPDRVVEYPSGWVVRVPEHGLELHLEPLVQDQELRLTFRYWEGAVRVRGSGRGGPVTGRGYVELTGYGEAAAVPR